MKLFELTKIFLILLFGFQVYGQSDLSTNLDIYKSLYRDIIESFLDELPGSEQSISLVALDPSFKENWIIEQQWIKALQDQQYNVFSGDSVKDNNRSLLYFRPVKQKVTYKNDGKYIRRNVFVDCYVKCTASKRRVLFSRSLHKSMSDKISRKDLSLIENPLIASTHAEKPVSRWKQWIEPLIVSVVSGTIITLFYSYRSK